MTTISRGSYNSFITLVRLGIGHIAAPITNPIQWNEIEALAMKHGLSAIVLDGIEKLPEAQRPPKEIVLQWIGNVMQGYESRYVDYEKSIWELAGFYNKHGIKMMVIKGYGLGLNYPSPKHRPCGDIDIWCFGKGHDADNALRKECGITIDTSHHIHTVFLWDGFTVENHYDMVNVYRHHRNKRLNRVLKELALDDSRSLCINGQCVYMPSIKFNALFLINHALAHFAASEINLRQVLDWGLFVKNNSSDIDWLWLNEILIQFKMKEFFECLNAICVDDLGFSASLFPIIQINPQLKERVLNNIICPNFAERMPSDFFPRLVWKIRRWHCNAWKQDLCYKESRLSSLFHGILSHLIKPSTI